MNRNLIIVIVTCKTGTWFLYIPIKSEIYLSTASVRPSVNFINVEPFDLWPWYSALPSAEKSNRPHYQSTLLENSDDTIRWTMLSQHFVKPLHTLWNLVNACRGFTTELTHRGSSWMDLLYRHNFGRVQGVCLCVCNQWAMWIIACMQSIGFES